MRRLPLASGRRAAPPAGRPPRGPSMSRPLLERTVRRASALSRTSRSARECAVERSAELDGERITGSAARDGDAEIPADLVIDATGRQARSLGWIAAARVRPATDLAWSRSTPRYVTRRFRRQRILARDWKAAAIIDYPASQAAGDGAPDRGRPLAHPGRRTQRRSAADRRGRAAWPTRGVRLAGDRRPDGGQRAGRPTRHPPLPGQPAPPPRQAAAVPARLAADRRRGVQLRPDLRSRHDLGRTAGRRPGPCLDRAACPRPSFARSYFKAAARVVAAPWSIAVGGDFAYPGTTGRQAVRHRSVQPLHRPVLIAGQRDDAVAIRFNEVVSMVRRPDSLLAPRFAHRVLRASKPRTST